MLIFHTSEATTYEHAVGRKKTERKKLRATCMLLTNSASPNAPNSEDGKGEQ